MQLVARSIERLAVLKQAIRPDPNAIYIRSPPPVHAEQKTTIPMPTAQSSSPVNQPPFIESSERKKNTILQNHPLLEPVPLQTKEGRTGITPTRKIICLRASHALRTMVAPNQYAAEKLLLVVRRIVPADAENWNMLMICCQSALSRIARRPIDVRIVSVH